MRRRVLVFICLVLITLAIAPAVNILSKTLPAQALAATSERQEWWTYASYNLDFASSWLNRLLYQLGISTDPTQAIIGREGWLYLGDKYEQTRSVARRGQTAKDVSLGCSIASASEAWETWLQRKGVRLYRVMIAPNKGTIYPEHLPNWAKPSKSSAIDALVGCTGYKRYLDLRSALWHAKNETPDPLYYRTDTHWNSLGAAYAFSAFMGHLHFSDPILSWAPDPKISVMRVDSRRGGDLALLLRMSESLMDEEPVIGWLGEAPVETIQYDWKSGKAIRSGGNPAVGTSKTPINVISPRAPNKKKVLWLRDSFGTALSPFMASTFAETVQLHWRDALSSNGRLLIDLVESWHPDYVVVTVAERDARHSFFATMPPDGRE